MSREGEISDFFGEMKDTFQAETDPRQSISSPNVEPAPQRSSLAELIPLPPRPAPHAAPQTTSGPSFGAFDLVAHPDC